MTAAAPISIAVVADIVCPWCYIGKARLDTALAAASDVPVELSWLPFLLNPDMPREGMAQDDFLTMRFGSPEAYRSRSGQVKALAEAEGLVYAPELTTRQPSTIDAHRLILWAAENGAAAAMTQRLMQLYFAEGADLTDAETLVAAAAQVGLDADEVRSRLAGDQDIDTIRDTAAQLQQQGVSGVPATILAGKYLLSGALPADELARAIRQVAAES